MLRKIQPFLLDEPSSDGWTCEFDQVDGDNFV